MPATMALRPAPVINPQARQYRTDYTVLDRGRESAHLRGRERVARPVLVLVGDPRCGSGARHRHQGNTASLKQAQAQFFASWQALNG